MPRLLLSCALFASFLGLGVPKLAISNLHHGVVWYGTAPNDSVRALVARRYSIGATGKNEFNDFEKVQIKTLNPQFQWYVYNSGTDNYVPPATDTREHNALRDLALRNGWDPEIAYLHFWDDTRLVLEGDTLFIPGWGGGRATDPAEARIPTYYRNLTRRLCNFSTPQAAALYREIMVRLAFDTPFTGSSVYPDGIFLDNSTPIPFNYGRILSGGHVRETPDHLRLDSRQFHDWWWSQNLGPYLTSLKDTLETSATWSKDRKRKYLMINVANVWTDEYASRDVADVLGMEFQYNPVRNFGLNAIMDSYRRDSLAAGTGTRSFYLATNTRTVDGHTGSFTLPEVMLGSLCWFLLSRTPDSIFYQMGANNPSTPGWESLTWIGAMDIANRYLGEAVGAPYLLAQGTDPLGNAYRVHAREYQAGFVVLRNRGDYDEGIETGTAVNVPLPRRLSPIAPDGTMGFLVNQVSLRNGQGALFLYGVTPIVELSLTATREGPRARITWEPVAGSEPVSFDVYREDADATRVKLNQVPIPPDRPSFVDEQPRPLETRYWLAELSRTGSVTWHGPATLVPATVAPIRLMLAQNVPNPIRAGAITLIRFQLAREGPVHLQVVDVTGRRVALLLNEVMTAGEHKTTWDARDIRGRQLPPGIYMYLLTTSEGVRSRKLSVMR